MRRAGLFRAPMRRVLSPPGAPLLAQRMHPAGASPRISARTAAASPGRESPGAPHYRGRNAGATT